MVTPLVSLQQGNVKKSEKAIKMVNIEGENLRIFWTTWGISMTFSGEMWLMMILKVTKKQCFAKNPEKNHRGIRLLPLAFLGLKGFWHCHYCYYRFYFIFFNFLYESQWKKFLPSFKPKIVFEKSQHF